MPRVKERQKDDWTVGCWPVEIWATSDTVVGEMFRRLLAAKLLQRVRPQQVTHRTERRRLLESVQLNSHMANKLHKYAPFNALPRHWMASMLKQLQLGAPVEMICTSVSAGWHHKHPACWQTELRFNVPVDTKGIFDYRVRIWTHSESIFRFTWQTEWPFGSKQTTAL